MTLDLSLPATTAAPGEARAAVTEWLACGHQDELTTDNVRLLVTELVSNGVRHARTPGDDPLRLHAAIETTILRIELWNAGTDGTVALTAPRLSDATDNGGFGLNLVAMLSSDWGVDRDAHGTTVWLELPTAARNPTA